MRRRGRTTASALSRAAYRAQKLGAQYACSRPLPKGKSRDSSCKQTLISDSNNELQWEGSGGLGWVDLAGVSEPNN